MLSDRISVPFWLKIPQDVRMESNTKVFTTEYNLHGVARVEGPYLILEWSGNKKFIENRGIQVKLWTEPVPISCVSIPVSRLLHTQVHGRFFRVRLELQVSDLTTLASFPGEKQGQVTLWLKRKDRNSAKDLVNTIQFEAAELLLQEAEGKPIGLLPASSENSKIPKMI